MKIMLNISRSFLLILFTLSFSLSFSQSDTLKRTGPMKVVRMTTVKSKGLKPDSTFESKRGKEFVFIDGQIYKIDRKNLDPFFKTVPQAYKKWNASYVYTYVSIGTLVLAATATVLAFTDKEGKDAFEIKGASAAGMVISTFIFSQVARKKKKRAIGIYNEYNK